MDLTMKFSAHEKFFIRKGWLSKGLKNVITDPRVFVRKDINPMDTLGLGANMVKSLRYWLQAVGLTKEKPKEGQEVTDFGRIVWNNDKYMEEIGTLWLLHYRLATNQTNATSWHYFFNAFKPIEFSYDDFLTHINNFLRMNDKNISSSSIEADYHCIINTYVPRIKSNPEKVQPESNIDCPFGELGLIDIVDKRLRPPLYKKSQPKKDTLHPLIVLAVILEKAGNEKSIRISSIQNDEDNAGKIFNLDVILLANLLYKIELLKHIKVVRTAGLDVIEIKTKMSFLDCVKEYYKQINS
ncbi:hypothetical protein FACS1894188_02310 [Clostridia bacterium]|nr:hypothetical protein FACS1894188_02310 [Clostridia bacterium]